MTRNLLISYSGGETSGYMTKRLLDEQAATGRWAKVVVAFANSTQENEQTLEFVDRCDREMGFNVVWLEAEVYHGQRKASGFRVTSFKDARRNGEVFEEMIRKYGIPNASYPHCTRELKQNPIWAYAESLGWELGTYDMAVGIRSDEIDRISAHAIKNWGVIYPLIRMWPTRKPQVNAWWRDQPFRLDLKSWQGNCKACWKKTDRKLFSILRHQPDAFEFPIRMEAGYATVGGEFMDASRLPNDLFADYRRVFFRGNRSALDVIAQFERIGHLYEDFHDEAQVYDEAVDVGGGCGDSCEVFSDQYEMFAEAAA